MSAANWLRLVFLSVLWGGSFLFVEVALGGLPVLSIVWGRVGLAALLLAAVLMISGTAFPKGWPVWRALLVMGLLNNAIPFTLFVVAQGQISASLAAILNATTPLFGVLVAHFATADERLSWRKVVALGLGFAGVVVTVGSGAEGHLGASLACLAAAFSYALAGVWGRRFARLGVSPLATAFGQVASSTAMLTPLWLIIDRPWALAAPPMPVLTAILGIAALSTALAYLIYFRLLASAGATNLLLVTFLIPVSATALGVVLLGETLLARHVAGFALIALGLIAIDGRLLPRWSRRLA